MRRPLLVLALFLSLAGPAAAQTLKILGLGPEAVILDRTRIEALGLGDIRIGRDVSGPGGTQRSEIVYTGIDLPKLLDAHGFEALDRYAVRGATILVVAHDGYKASFSWGELYNHSAGRQVLLVLKEDGGPLPARAGAFALRALGDSRPGPRNVRDVAEIRVILPQ